MPRSPRGRGHRHGLPSRLQPAVVRWRDRCRSTRLSPRPFPGQKSWLISFVRFLRAVRLAVLVQDAQVVDRPAEVRPALELSNDTVVAFDLTPWARPQEQKFETASAR